MPLRTESEIVKAVNDRKDKVKELQDRFERDFGYYRLEPYKRGRDYKSITSNEPRTLADKIVNLLAQADFQIRIPIDKELEGERKNISNAERFLVGMLNHINARMTAMAQPDLISQMVWHSVVRGWYALRAYIIKAKDGSTKPKVDVWDMLHTYYELGDEGMLWVCHTRTASASQLKAEYNIDIKGENLKVYDFWDDEIYAVVANNQFLIKPTDHELKRLPALIMMGGAMPLIESDKYTDTIKDAGESWLASNRNLVKPINELLSDLLTIVARGTKVPLKGFNIKEMDDSPWGLDKGQAALVHLKRSEDKDLDQDIVPMIEPTMPKDAAAIVNILSSMWQQGGLPKGAWGDIGFQISGYLFNQLKKQMGSTISVGGKSVETGMSWLCRELLMQFSNGSGFEPVKVEGKDYKGQYFGPIELKPEDVKGDWFPEFRLLPELPEDEMERYAMARIAHEGENPLLSDQSINDRILHIQDPDLEETIKLEQWAMNLPPIRLRRVATALAERGRPDLADEIMRLLEQPQGLPGGERPKGPEAVQPEFATGVPNSVFPAEMLGRTPPTTPQGKSPEELRLAKLGLLRGV